MPLASIAWHCSWSPNPLMAKPCLACSSSSLRNGIDLVCILLGKSLGGCWHGHKLDKGGLARSRAWCACEPGAEAVEVHGGGSEHVLQVGFGEPDLAGTARCGFSAHGLPCVVDKRMRITVRFWLWLAVQLWLVCPAGPVASCPCQSRVKSWMVRAPCVWSGIGCLQASARSARRCDRARWPPVSPHPRGRRAQGVGSATAPWWRAIHARGPRASRPTWLIRCGRSSSHVFVPR